MPGFLGLTTANGDECYIRADQVEAVIADPNGSRVRTRRIAYNVIEQPSEVLKLLGHALGPLHDQGYFSSEPCVSD